MEVEWDREEGRPHLSAPMAQRSSPRALQQVGSYRH